MSIRGEYKIVIPRARDIISVNMLAVRPIQYESIIIHGLISILNHGMVKASIDNRHCNDIKKVFMEHAQANRDLLYIDDPQTIPPWLWPKIL